MPADSDWFSVKSCGSNMEFVNAVRLRGGPLVFLLSPKKRDMKSRTREAGMHPLLQS